MNETIINREALPEHILARIHSSRVLIQEHDDSITLTPVAEKNTAFSSLVGMLAGKGVSTEAYFRQKQLDKELE
jgi:hypothetical protein